MAAHAAIVLCLTFAAAVSTTGCAQSNTIANEDTPQARTQTIMRVAHRGGSALAPENTLAAFTMGLTTDPDALELDIHVSKDGVLMVMHDPLLERTAGEPLQISDYTAAELATFNAAKTHKDAATVGFQPIPTLEQVIDLIDASGKQVGMQIEIKVKQDGSRYDGIEEKLVQMLRSRGRLESTVVISFDFPSLETIARLEPTLKRGALISKKYMTAIGAKGPKAVAEDMAALGVDYVGINYSYLSKTLYQEFRAKGLGVGAWTVNEPEAIVRMAELGLDFSTSDRPDLLRDLLVRAQL
jgi:glycerophosphoryl diester phosphodiesterase